MRLTVDKPQLIRVLIVDDHAVVRRGLRTFLDVQGDIEVVGEAASGEECLALAATLIPDVILLDLQMPGIGGVETVRALQAASMETESPQAESPRAESPRAESLQAESLQPGEGNGASHPGPRVLVVTSFRDPSVVMPAVRAGASGVVYKDVEPRDLASAIRSVHAGHVLLQPDVAAALLAPTSGSAPDLLAALTGREREVLAEIARGRSNREIARGLSLAEKTVKTHVSNVLMKLGVADRTQAAIFAVRNGAGPAQPH
jgi:DNA-binding NarL/FixJ family response regulator